MSRLSVATMAAALAVGVVSVLALGDAAAPRPTTGGAPEDVPTSEATLACPGSPASRTTKATLLAVTPVAADEGASAGVRGSLTAATLEPQRNAVATATEPGEAIVHWLTTKQQPAVVVDAKGEMSAGASAFQWAVEGGRQSGRSVSACAASGTDWWFNGVDTAVGSTSRLVLTNTTPAVAVADVDIFGPRGAVETVGQRGIALAPDTRQSVDLARFAPNLSAASVHVAARVGRLSAAIETTRKEGVTPRGSEWLPPAEPPTTDAVIDAALPDVGSQELQIVNPGDAEAIVQVQVVDATGPFVPAGLDSLRVPPQTVKAVDLGKVSHGDPVSVRLTSETAVSGAVVSTAKGDYAVAAPSPSLSGTTVVPVVPDADLSLRFTGAQQGGGELQIAGFSREGDQAYKAEIDLKGLRTTEWKPPKRQSRAAAYLLVTVVVDPHVQAVAQYAARDGVAELPLVPGVFTVVRPAVTPSR